MPTKYYTCFPDSGDPNGYKGCGNAHRNRDAAHRCTRRRDQRRKRLSVFEFESPLGQHQTRSAIESDRRITSRESHQGHLDYRSKRSGTPHVEATVLGIESAWLDDLANRCASGKTLPDSPAPEEREERAESPWSETPPAAPVPVIESSSSLGVFTTKGQLSLDTFAAEVRKAGGSDIAAALAEFKEATEKGMQGFRDATSSEKLKEMVTDFLATRGTQKIVIDNKKTGKTKKVGRQHPRFPKLLEYIRQGQKIWIFGPTGSGKTTAAKIAADALDKEFYVQPPVDSKYELSGFRDGKGAFHRTPLAHWAYNKEGGVLCLDEIDACHQRAITGINSATGNGICIFANGDQVELGPDHIVIATANTTGYGATVEYNGRAKIDGAVLNRFSKRMFWDYDEAFEADLAIAQHGGTASYVRACQTIRANLRKHAIQVSWSPRDTFAYCKSRAFDMSHADALEDSCLSAIAEDQRKKALEGVSQIVQSATV